MAPEWSAAARVFPSGLNATELTPSNVVSLFVCSLLSHGLSEFPIAAPSGDGQDQLQAITAGPNGNVWFLDEDSPDLHLGEITPTGQITTFRILSGSLGTQVITGSIVEGSDGRVWFGAVIPSLDASGNQNEELEVGSVTPAGQIALHPIEQVEQLIRGRIGFDLTRGPDGNPWLSVGGSLATPNNPKPAIFRIDPSGHVKRFPISLASDRLRGAIASGPRAKLRPRGA